MRPRRKHLAWIVQRPPGGLATWYPVALLLASIWLASTLAISGTRPGVDLQAYIDAARAVAVGHDPYRSVTDYFYPPLLATALRPLAGLSDARFRALIRVALAACSVGLVFCLIVYAGLWGHMGAWLLLLLLLSHPLSAAIQFGNAQIIVTMLLALAGLLRERRPSVAGLLLAVATHVKVVPSLFVLYLVLRGLRQKEACTRRAALAAVLGVAAGLLLPWTRSFLRGALTGTFVSKRALAGSNFSWVGYANRAGWPLPPALLPLLCGGATAWLALGAQVGACHWAMLHALVLIASPITWYYTYTLALVPIADASARLRQGWHVPRIAPHRGWLWGTLALCLYVTCTAEWYFDMSEAGQLVLPLLPMLMPFVLLAILAALRPAP